MPSASSPAAPLSAAARWTPPVLWVIVILVATSWPGGFRYVPRIDGLDKVAHFALYSVLAALMLRATLTPDRWRTTLGVLLAVACFGALDEWHQQFIPRRAMSLEDWVADVVGAVIGLAAVRFIPFLMPRHRQRSS